MTIYEGLAIVLFALAIACLVASFYTILGEIYATSYRLQLQASILVLLTYPLRIADRGYYPVLMIVIGVAICVVGIVYPTVLLRSAQST